MSVNIDYSKRNLGLDIIRCTAILLVVFCHAIPTFYPYVHGKFEKIFNIAVWGGGFYGVELFFVLSGFLIGNIFIKSIVVQSDRSLEKSLSSNIIDFWRKRWIRTLPSYWLFILINILLIPLSKANFDWKILIYYLLFFQGFGNNDTSFFGVSWSLAVEEWFYLLLPIFFVFSFILFKKRRAEKSFILAMLILLILPMSLKIVELISLPKLSNIEPIYHFRTVYKLDSIFYGILMSWIWNKANLKSWFLKHQKNLFIIGFTSLFISVFYAAFFILKPLQYSILVLLYAPLCSISVMLCFPYMLTTPFSKNTSIAKWITKISLCSYSFYLCHIPIYTLIDSLIEYLNLPENIFISILIFVSRVGLSFICAQLLYQYFEMPILKWRDKISNKIALKNKVISQTPNSI